MSVNWPVCLAHHLLFAAHKIQVGRQENNQVSRGGTRAAGDAEAREMKSHPVQVCLKVSGILSGKYVQDGTKRGVGHAMGHWAAYHLFLTLTNAH